MKKIFLLGCFIIVAATIWAQNRRIALVIGNSNYNSIRSLVNPMNDARAMESALKECGFDVIRLENATKRSIENKVKEFTEKLKNYDTGLFFYAGHGMEVSSANYIVPVDVADDITEVDVIYNCVNTNWVQSKMAESGTIGKTNILILDACRDNPFRKMRSREITSDSWSPPKEIPTGMITCYAASLGEKASDGKGKNGLYTSILLRHLRTRGITIETVFKRVRIELLQKGGQKPIESTSLTEDFYFVPGTTPTMEKKTPAETPKQADTYSSTFADFEEPLTTGNSIKMVALEGGTFQMGSESGGSDENPIHQVSVADFYIGRYEITQKQWRAIMGTDPSYFKNCDDCPVENVSWNDVQEFLSKLNAKIPPSGARGKYRLPTEAEWEYAARGGNKSQGYTYSGNNTIDEVAWYSGNSGSKTHAETKKANELGIFDMSGNVWEWCSDWYDKGYYKNSPSSDPKGASSGSTRVIRGGSWFNEPRYCRVANRDIITLGYRGDILGFRVVFSQ
jgi:formylglycine-generating enzyme required for sulfatase activity